MTLPIHFHRSSFMSHGRHLDILFCPFPIITCYSRKCYFFFLTFPGMDTAPKPSAKMPAQPMCCRLRRHFVFPLICGNLIYFITIFISTRKCCFYSVFRYLSSDLLHFYSKFKPIFSIRLLLLFSFLLKRACINQLSLPAWNDLKVSVLLVGLRHFHNTL